jgi:Helix-hairpin-helix motif
MNKDQVDAGTEIREKVRINYDSADEIARLHNVGPALAKRVVEARKRALFHGPEDLARIRGFSVDLVSTLAPFIDWSVPDSKDGAQHAVEERVPTSWTANAEFVLKISTALLGIVYVLGLLVSNLQMMELGISDFSPLQARNVSVGILFLVFLMLVVLIVSACLVLVWTVIDAYRGRSRLQVPAWTLLMVLIGLITVASFVGYLSPSGLPWFPGWDDWNSSHFDRELQTFATLWNQFSDAFVHPKVLMASGALALWALAVSSGAHQGKKGLRAVDARIRHLSNLWRLWSPALIVWAIAGLLALTALVMVDYADEVYPNLRYNLGGGQPRVATLQIGTENGRRIVLAGFPAEEQTGVTGPVVIWHQSDKFLYVTSLFELPVGRAQMAGLGLGDIRSIQYLPAYVEVSSGYRILSVHPPRDSSKN